MVPCPNVQSMVSMSSMNSGQSQGGPWPSVRSSDPQAATATAVAAIATSHLHVGRVRAGLNMEQKSTPPHWCGQPLGAAHTEVASGSGGEARQVIEDVRLVERGGVLTVGGLDPVEARWRSRLLYVDREHVGYVLVADVEDAHAPGRIGHE